MKKRLSVLVALFCLLILGGMAAPVLAADISPANRAVNPVTKTLYVVNNGASPTRIYVFPTNEADSWSETPASNFITFTAPYAAAKCFGTAVSPDGSKLYVSVNNGANSRINIYTLSGGLYTGAAPTSMTGDSWFADDSPAGMAVGEDNRLFVADKNTGRMIVYNTATNTRMGQVTEQLAGKRGLFNVAVSPAIREGSNYSYKIYISRNNSSGEIYVFSYNSSSADSYNILYERTINSSAGVPIVYPTYLKVKNGWLYVAVQDRTRNIIVYNADTGALVGRVCCSLSNDYGWVGFDLSSDGNWLYFKKSTTTNEASNNIYRIQTARIDDIPFTDTYAELVSANVASRYADGMAVSPAGNHLALTNSVLGSIVVFDSLPPGTSLPIVTDMRAAGGIAQATVDWTNPTDANLAEIVFARGRDSTPNINTSGTVIVGEELARYLVTDPHGARGAANHYVDTPLAGGSYYYVVFARNLQGDWNTRVDNDSAGGVNCAGATVLENAPPTGFSKVTPRNNGSARENVTFTWEASVDPDEGSAITYIVEITSEAGVVSTTTSATSITIPASRFSIGTNYRWQVRARDARGAVTYANGSASKTWLFTYTKKLGPTATITSPAAGSSVSGSITLRAKIDDRANGGSNITAAEYCIDSTSAPKTSMALLPAGTSASKEASADYNTTATSEGIHTLYVRGRDASGEWGSYASVEFIVNNLPDGPVPTVTSIDPNSGVQGQTVPIINIVGTNFDTFAGVNVTLQRAGQDPISAPSSSIVVSDNTHVSCRLPISSEAEVGYWNVVVTNKSDAQSGTLANGFLIFDDLDPHRMQLDSIDPNRGQVGTSVSFTLQGSNFTADSAVTNRVRLARSGQSDIVSPDVRRVSSTEITGTFNLTGAELGAWTVIYSPVLASGTPYAPAVWLENGFTVTSEAVGPGDSDVVSSISIFREGSDVVVTWETTPAGTAVDIYSLTCNTDASGNYATYFTTEASAWGDPIKTNDTSGRLEIADAVGAGNARYFKLIRSTTPRTPLTSADLTSEVVGKFDVAVGPEPERFFISAPLILTDGTLENAIGNQVVDGDWIGTFSDIEEITSGSSHPSGSWQDFPVIPAVSRIAAIENGRGYGYFTGTSRFITLVGRIPEVNYSIVLTGGAIAQPNWIGQPYPIPVAIGNAGFNATNYSSNISEASRLFRLQGNSEAEGGLDGLAFHRAEAEWTNGTFSNPSPIIITPGKGYYLRDLVNASPRWEMVKPY